MKPHLCRVKPLVFVFPFILTLIGAAALAPNAQAQSNPGTVSNLSVASVTGSSVTLSFTEVNDGTGQPAKYDVRFAAGTINWGSAASVTQGTCATPLAGNSIGATKTCTVTGLSVSTAYQFRLVAYRGTLNQGAVFGGLSNVASGTTAATNNPGTVANLSVTSVTASSATLAFTEVNDGTGQPAKYDVRFATNPISWGSAASVTQGTCATPLSGTTIGATKTCSVTGLSAATAYQFQLVAFRGTLNQGAVFGSLSNVASATTSAGSDTTPPTVSITNPPNGATVSGNVTVSANASDSGGVKGVQFKRNGVNLGSEDTTAPYSVVWNTTSVANGASTLTATARDNAGNTKSASVNVTVSNAPPPPPGGALFSETFESGDLSAWDEVADQARVTQERVHSGSYALKVDQPGYGWGGELQKDLPNRNQIYLSLWWYVPQNLDLRALPGRHYWRIGGPLPPGANSPRQLDTGSDNGNLQVVSFWGDEVSYWGTLPGNGFPRDRWFRFSIFYKLNTPGQANGELTIWIDGVRVFQALDEEYRQSTDPINLLRMVTNFDNCNPSQYGCHWYYDDIEVRDTLPAVP